MTKICKKGNKSILDVTRQKRWILFCSDGFRELRSVAQNRSNQYCINSFECRKHWRTHTDCNIIRGVTILQILDLIKLSILRSRFDSILDLKKKSKAQIAMQFLDYTFMHYAI